MNDFQTWGIEPGQAWIVVLLITGLFIAEILAVVNLIKAAR